jgi:hypothetical protein
MEKSMTDQSIIEDAKAADLIYQYNEQLRTFEFRTKEEIVSRLIKFAQLQAARQSSQSEPVARLYVDSYSNAHVEVYGNAKDIIADVFLAAPQQAIPSEATEEMKDGARSFLGGLELGIKSFEDMASHLELSGAYLPRWFLQSKGHLNKMAKAHYIYEAMLSASPTAPIERDK